MNDDLKELEQLVEAYKSDAAAAPAAFNWIALLPILKLVLPLVVQDERIREIVQKVLDILGGLIPTTGEASE